MVRPIVFIHRGCPDYLKITLTRARQYNPDSPLFLLGDSSNAHLVREVPGLDFELIQCDSGDSAKFAGIYQHQSHLTEEFERFCLQRWILLRDLMRQRNWDRLLHLDSDVLLYSEIEQTGKRFDNSVMSLAPWFQKKSYWCGHTCFINTPDVLGEFVDFLFEFYTTEEGKQLREKCYAEDREPVSDMTCLGFFRQQTSRTIADMSQIMENSVFDDFITSTREIYEKGSRFLKKDLKRIVFKDSVPYCQLKENGKSIRFLSLHFHGSTKYLIKHFAKNHLDVFTMMAIFGERVMSRVRRMAYGKM